jgi:hypothetical protein
MSKAKTRNLLLAKKAKGAALLTYTAASFWTAILQTESARQDSSAR